MTSFQLFLYISPFLICPSVHSFFHKTAPLPLIPCFFPSLPDSFVHLLIRVKLITRALALHLPSLYIYISHLFIHPSVFCFNQWVVFRKSFSLECFPPNTAEVLTDTGRIGRAVEKPNCCNHIYLALICVFDMLSQRPDNRSVGRAEPRAVKTRRSARAMLNTQHLGPP